VSSELKRKAKFPTPVPAPVSARLLNIRKTSLTELLLGSVSTASPAIASKGNWSRTFSGIRHSVKAELQLAIVAAEDEARNANDRNATAMANLR